MNRIREMLEAVYIYIYTANLILGGVSYDTSK